MLVIRKEQMEVFKKAEIEYFENRMLKHLRSVFPIQTKIINDDELLKLIQVGINNSQKYGIKMEWDIRRYLECSVLYGWDFDENQKTKWATEILSDQSIDGKIKMDKIEQFDANVK
jgi:hypothetical protein